MTQSQQHTASLPAVSLQHASGALHCTTLPQQHLCTTIIAAQAGMQRNSSSGFLSCQEGAQSMEDLQHGCLCQAIDVK